jgi:hypothetical protein
MTIDSKLRPVTDENNHFVIVFRHKDGRIRTLRHGGYSEDTAQIDAYVAKHGNVAGLTDSVNWHESFPGEQVCWGCVSSVERYRVKDGRTSDHWTHSPMFREYRPDSRGWWGLDWCPACAEKVLAEVEAQYLRDMTRAEQTYTRKKAAVTVTPALEAE